MTDVSIDEIQKNLAELSGQVVDEATRKHVTLATAESLTAGACAAAIADTPGASAVLRGGLIVYATELKEILAGVDRDRLVEHGPVDPIVAQQMARGAAQRCQADIGVGLSGVAGPDPQDGHQVGEVYIGISSSHGKRSLRLNLGCLSRMEIRLLAAESALKEIVAELDTWPSAS